MGWYGGSIDAIKTDGATIGFITRAVDTRQVDYRVR